MKSIPNGYETLPDKVFLTLSASVGMPVNGGRGERRPCEEGQTEGLSSAFTGSGWSQASHVSVHGSLQKPGCSQGHTVTGQESTVGREHREMLVKKAGR